MEVRGVPAAGGVAVGVCVMGVAVGASISYVARNGFPPLIVNRGVPVKKAVSSGPQYPMAPPGPPPPAGMSGAPVDPQQIPLDRFNMMIAQQKALEELQERLEREGTLVEEEWMRPG